MLLYREHTNDVRLRLQEGSVLFAPDGIELSFVSLFVLGAPSPNRSLLRPVVLPQRVRLRFFTITHVQWLTGANLNSRFG